MRIICDGMDAYAQYAVSIQNGGNPHLLMLGFFGRAKTKIKAIKQCLGDEKAHFSMMEGYHSYTYRTTISERWWGAFQTMNRGRERFTYCVAVAEAVGKRFLFTSNSTEDKDWYEFLMKNYKLPLLKEWIPTIREECIRVADGVVRASTSIKYDAGYKIPSITLNGMDIPVNEIMVYDFLKMNEESFEKIVSRLLRNGKIRFTEKPQKPLIFQGMDEYFLNYGTLAVENLTKKINPLTELRANVSNLALKQKSLFPQQAASVEGICAMYREGISYAVLNHGMGCGKTLEAASACEAIAVEKYLKAHPGKTLKDAYERDDLIHYRTIIMAPGHLVEKWASEIREEIPYAKTTVITELSQLVQLREDGRTPANGKEFFIVGKDKVKLGSQQSPVPTKIASKFMALSMCEDCFESDGRVVYKKGFGQDAFCPSCRGNNFVPSPQTQLGKFVGLVCPVCGELLLTYRNISNDSDVFLNTPESLVLHPKDFASPNQANSTCYHCGASLWSASCKPLIMGNVGKERRPKWYKVSHPVNYSGKSTKTAWVLRGFEEEYQCSQVNAKTLVEQKRQYGPRRVAMSRYIKKYLKGYFDFCILDECHKYLGESAQAVSAHSLIKASKFTMALTGTISNGTAECFYNLFYMLEPHRMLEMGYEYSSGEKFRFSKEFGCVETIYSLPSNTDLSRISKNATSRGKVLVPAKVKPGISPVLFGKMLMDRCLFMDISDLSAYLPALKEEVRVVDGEPEVMRAYRGTIDCLKDASKSGAGQGVLSIMLQFGLNYLDKPYDRSPVMHPFVQDCMICRPKNFEQYGEPKNLLPKEIELVNIVNSELSEGRNCFIYATATASAESNVLERLKMVIEQNCSLTGRVEIIRSETPAASEREAYFHKRASEGIRVFICNPKCVETGLDFCFKYEGVSYNYPTLIFYQISYELATIWQASRRAYRLSQKEECRNFYLAYNHSLQVTALQIMAKKQVATAAIQGHFSAEGLASMAQGVDARTLLAEALAKNDNGNADELAGMFDVLNSQASEVEDAYTNFIPSKTFYELVGKDAESVSGMASMFEEAFANFNAFSGSVEEDNAGESLGDFEAAFDSLFEKMFDAMFSNVPVVGKTEDVGTEPVQKLTFDVPVQRTKKKRKDVEGQMLLFAVS